MFGFKNLKDILCTTIEWEKQLRDLYNGAEPGLKTKESKNYVPDEGFKFTPDMG